jgi:hypothetical protein
MDSFNNVVFIHIGKCGGLTITHLLNQHRIPHTNVHIQQPFFHPAEKYMIVIRNPIARFISAFHWRYKLVIKEKQQESRFKGEAEILNKYSSINEFAENIAEFNIQTTYIHHIAEDIHFYLGDFLKHCQKENICGVITTETMNTDIRDLFGIENTIHENNNEGYDNHLSSEGYANLKRFLHKDYACIDRLYQMGVLSEEKYEILSK